MSKFISSVAIVFSSDADLIVSSLFLDHNSGCTTSQALSCILKNPIVKSYLARRYTILNITFKYSEL